MMKKDLINASGITTNAMAKLGKNQCVTTDVLCKICNALDCDISDIMEMIKDNGESKTIEGQHNFTKN